MRFPEMKRRVSCLIIGLALVSATALARGQEQPRRAAREDLEGLMEAYVISKLQESLELSDQQFAQMVVAQKRISGHRREHRNKRQKMLQQLRRALNDPGTEDDQIADMLNQLKQAQVDIEAQQRADYQEIDKILGVRQQARYRILELEIQRRFQQMARQVRDRQRPK
jgi:hypothetical protein